MGSVSYYATRRLSIGACFNVFYQSLPAYNGDGGLTYTTATSTGSFDFAAQYRLIPGVWTLAAVLKNIGTRLNWVAIDTNGLDETDQYQPNLVLGSSLRTSLADRPLIWNLDCRISIYGDSTQSSDQGDVTLSTGAEWREWDNFYVRAGIGEVTINSDLFNNRVLYANEFSPRYSVGFAYNLTNYLHKNTWFNYAASTDRIWEGLDQQFDVAISF
jgi:predicted porin